MNIANRLHEEGLTLQQFRQQQKEKRRAYLKRRGSRLRTLMEKNAEFVGTTFLQVLIQERDQLWIGRFDGVNQEGRLLENQIYHLIIRFSKKRRQQKLAKLELAFLCPLSERGVLLRAGRVELEHAAKNYSPAHTPNTRFRVDGTLLEQSIDKGQLLSIRLLNGLWLQGSVLWFDPYQIGLRLVDGEKGNEQVVCDLVLFCHAIDDIRESLPSSWEEWPTFQDVYIP